MPKSYNFKTFKLLNEEKNSFIEVICFTEDTRNGFKHVAVCEPLGLRAKVNYLNRTWERFRYETVLEKIKVEIEEKTKNSYKID